MSVAEQRVEAFVERGADHWRDPASAAGIPPAVARELARRWLHDEARDRERRAARAREEAAEKAARDERARVFEERQRERWQAEADEADARSGFQRWLDSQPLRTVKQGDHVAIVAVYDAYYSREVSGAQALRAWSDGDELGALAILSPLLDERVANLRARWAEEDRAMRELVDSAIDERAAAAGIEWTSGLLTTSVALPSGERVPWGEATVEQHEARIAMLAAHAASEMSTASRHRAAVDAIKAAPGARCLNDVVSVAA